MNFLVASLVYHCNREIAFWLLTFLFENFSLRQNYIQGFAGYFQHSKMLEDYLEFQNYDLMETLHQKGVQMDMISLDPIMGLFTNIIPLEHSVSSPLQSYRTFSLIISSGMDGSSFTLSSLCSLKQYRRTF
jgi:hypothetical protein